MTTRPQDRMTTGPQDNRTARRCTLQRSHGPSSAFTMVEIAIALAVIAFALIAIVGVLPTGLTTQKDNREETIINQDAQLLLEAIRGGHRGLNYLTNHVVQISYLRPRPNADPVTVATYVINPTGDPALAGGWLTNGFNIIGYLSRPKYKHYAESGAWETNIVTAHVRALNTSAVEQGTDMAFTYLVTVETTPFTASAVIPDIPANPADLMAFTNYPPGSIEYQMGRERWERASQLGRNFLDNPYLRDSATLYEIRLTFQWPLLPNGNTGNGRKVFRSLVSGRLESPDPEAMDERDRRYERRYFFEPYAYIPRS